MLDWTPLRDAIPALERWYDVRIVVTDSAMLGRQMKGTFAVGSVADLSQILSVTLHAHVVRGRARLDNFTVAIHLTGMTMASIRRDSEFRMERWLSHMETSGELACSFVVCACTLLLGVSSVGAQISSTVFPAHTPSGVFGMQPGRLHSPARVSVDVLSMPIEAVIGEVVRQAHMRVVYDSSKTALSKRVTFRFNGVGVAEALKSVLAGTGLQSEFASDGETILVYTGKGSMEHSGDILRAG